MARTAIDYLKLLLSLLPRGATWNRHVGRILGWGAFCAGYGEGYSGARMSRPEHAPSVMGELLHGQAQELARVDARSERLLLERDTRYTDELLTDHEADFGLPDYCLADAELTLDQRRTVLWLKLRALGQQNKEYFISLAESLGFPDSLIEEFRPGWSGILKAGEPCGDQSNLFYWRLWLAQATEWQVLYFTAGESNAGDYVSWLPLAEVIDCLIAQRYKPAHTQMLWGYYGYEYDRDFDFSFPSLPPMQDEQTDGLRGSFHGGNFAIAYDILAGGAFDNDLGYDYDKPNAVPPSMDPAGGEIIIRPDASDRDGEEAVSTGNVDVVRITVYTGAGVDGYYSCFQFQLPYGRNAMVSEVSLMGYWTNRLAESRMTIYVEDIDDALIIVPGAAAFNISTRPLVSSGGVPLGIPWIVPAGPDGWIRSPNFAALLQEVINRTGWAADQYVSVIVRDAGSVGG